MRWKGLGKAPCGQRCQGQGAKGKLLQMTWRNCCDTQLQVGASDCPVQSGDILAKDFQPDRESEATWSMHYTIRTCNRYKRKEQCLSKVPPTNMKFGGDLYFLRTDLRHGAQVGDLRGQTRLPRRLFDQQWVMSMSSPIAPRKPHTILGDWSWTGHRISVWGGVMAEQVPLMARNLSRFWIAVLRLRSDDVMILTIGRWGGCGSLTRELCILVRHDSWFRSCLDNFGFVHLIVKIIHTVNFQAINNDASEPGFKKLINNRFNKQIRRS